MKRRDFVNLCAASAAGAALPDSTQAATLSAHPYARVKLVDERGQPFRIASLEAGKTYVFDYPYAATPCFLLKLTQPLVAGLLLHTESGETYVWSGGVGPDKSVVAYSAICAHKMTYPTKQVSFIGYRDNRVTCCSDRSVYDPASGAKVVSGPAPQPLATILLEHDPKSDELFALGAMGGEKFAEFFQKYSFRLQLEMGNRSRASVEGTTQVRLIDNYSAQWAKC